MLNTRILSVITILLLGIGGAYSLFENQFLSPGLAHLPISRERMVFDPFKFKTHSLPQYARLTYPSILRMHPRGLSLCEKTEWLDEHSFLCILSHKDEHSQLKLSHLLLNQPNHSPTQRKWNRWLKEGLKISTCENSLTFSQIPDRNEFLALLDSPYFLLPEDLAQQIVRFNMGTEILTDDSLRLVALDNDTQSYIYFALGFIDQTRRVPTSALFLKSDSLQGDSSTSSLIRSPIYRFEYLGFSQKMKSILGLIKSIDCSLDKLEFAKLTQTSIQYSYLPRYLESTYQPKCATLKTRSPSTRFDLFYPASGGQDMARVMAWIQESMRAHSLDTHLRAEEPKLFLKNLRSRQYDFYRKGLTLDLPSCRNLLENFSSSGGESQALSTQGLKIVDSLLLKTNLSWSDCRRAFETLADADELIPLGTYEIIGIQNKRAAPIDQWGMYDKFQERAQ